MATRTARAAAALAGVGLIAMVGAASLAAPLQFDDWAVIGGTRATRSLADWWASMPGIRPLLKLSWALQAEMGAGPAGLRAVNLAIHAVNTVLVAAVLGRLATGGGMTGPSGITARRRAPIGAAFGALVFALHPVQTEAVTYLSGRSVSLSAMFTLAGMWCWLDREQRPRLARWGVPLTLALALGCRETAAMLPLALLLCERWQLRRAQVRSESPIAGRVSAPLRALAGSAVVLIATALAASALPRYRGLWAISIGLHPPAELFWTQLGGFGWLVGQLSGMAALNADPALPVRTAPDAITAITLAGGLVTIGYGIRSWRRGGVTGFAIAWFLLWLAPTQTLLARLDIANDRHLYLALVGPAWWLGTAVARLPARAALAMVVATAVALALATAQRNRVYASEIAFWRAVVADAPHNARGHNNLGWALAQACQAAAADAEFGAAIALAGDATRAAMNRQWLREGRAPLVAADCAATR